MKLHRRSVLSFFQGYSTQAPDQEGLLLKKGSRNSSYQRRWFVLRGNLLFYLERRQDPTPLGLILLENCQVQPRSKAAEPFAFSILTPGAAEGAGGRAYRLAAETQEELGAWLQALAGVSWRRLASLLPVVEAQYRALCQAAGQKPSSPDKDCGFAAITSPTSSFLELHERFGAPIRLLLGTHRGPQKARDGDSRSQAEAEEQQEPSPCLLRDSEATKGQAP